MNLKKLKRLTSIVLSMSMILSMNMTGFAAETAGREQAASRGQGSQSESMVLDTSDEKMDLGDMTEDGTAAAGESGQDAAQTPADRITAGGTDGVSLKEALETASAAGAAVTTVELAGDVVLEGGTYGLTGVTVKTNGHTITVEAGVILNGTGTFINDQTAVLSSDGKWTAPGSNKTIFYVKEGAALTINAGTYQTAGVKLLIAEGNATINGGTFTSTLEKETADFTYDGASLINVRGKGVLTMTEGTVDADRGNNADNAANKNQDGMYGIFVNDGGTAILGKESAKGMENAAADGPQITSRLAAVGMNYTMPTGNVTIYSGTYKTTISSADTEQFNAVFYLAALCDVTIYDGKFEAIGTEKTHIMSAPYTADRNVIIEGGQFNSKGAALIGAGFTGKKVIKGGTFTNSTGLEAYVVSGYELNLPAEGGAAGVQPVDNTVAVLKSGTGETAKEEKYLSLNDALTAMMAAQEAVTIELKKDAVLAGAHNYTFPEGAKILTNGHTITIAGGAKVKLTDATIINDRYNESLKAPWTVMENNHIVLSADIGSKLVLSGGTFETSSTQILNAAGDVTVTGNAVFRCTATGEELQKHDYYDGAVLINVEQGGVLKMADGTVNSDVGNGTDCGMYGIYVNTDGAVILGEEGKPDAGPTVNSAFAAVGMNSTLPTATVTIHGGTYNSSVNCAQTHENFNAVLYLSATSDVTINGGTFAAISTAADKPLHVVSIPYQSAGVKLKINSGTFNAAKGTDVFYFDSSIQDKKVVNGGTFSTDPTDYLAGGRSAKRDETSKMWNVSVGCDHMSNGTSAITAVPAKDASCTEEGNSAYYTCSVCEQKFYTATGWKDADKKEPSTLTDSEVRIEKLSHKAKLVQAKETGATCQEIEGTEDLYICEYCGNGYANMTDLKKDQNVVKKDSIKYGAHDAKGAYTVNWGVDEIGTNTELTVKDKAAFNALDKKLTSAKATVTQVCNTCREAIPAEGTVAVTGGNLNNYNCTEAAEVIYTATLTPSSGTGTSVGTCKITIPAGQHVYKYTWAVTDSQSPITVTRTCENCGAKATAAKTNITEKDGSALTTKCWDETREVKVTASGFTTGVTDDAEETTMEMLIKGQHSLEPQPYKAPTCKDDGCYMHYYCDKCKAYYANPMQTEWEDKKEEAAFTITKLPHDFGAPDFTWDDETALKAKATFTCRKCDSMVILKDSLVTVEEPTNSGQIDCESGTPLNYPVTVDFDATKVGDEVGEDGFGDSILDYTGTKGDGDSYPGKLESVSVKGHRFEVTECVWVDENDMSQGATATLTCVNCKKSVEVHSTKGVEQQVPGITNASGRIRMEKAPALCTEPTCTSKGTDVYTVTVQFKTGDAVAYTDYTELAGAAGEEAEPITLENVTAAKGHDYVIMDVNEKKDVGVAWDNPEEAAKNPDQPSDVIITLTCKNNQNHRLFLAGKDEDNKDNVVLKDATSEKDYPDTPYVAQTCTEDGVNAWAVQVIYQDKLYTKYNEPGTDVSTSEKLALAEEEEETAPKTGTIYVTKIKPKTGHKYPDKGTWDYSRLYDNGQIVNTAGPVYYTYTCQNANCSAEAESEVDNGAVVEVSGGAKRWQKRLEAEIYDVTRENGLEPAGCKESGYVVYEFEVKNTDGSVLIRENPFISASNPKGSIQVNSLGHEWNSAQAEWKWTVQADAEQDKWIELKDKDDNTYKVPPCTVQVVRSCNRSCGEKDTITATLGEATPTPGEDKAVIELTVKKYTAATCEEAGTITYAAVLKTADGVKVLSTAPDQTIQPAKLNHDNTGDIVIEWENGVTGGLSKENEVVKGYTYAVNAHIVCKNDSEHELELPEGVTVEVKPISGSCKDGDCEVTYQAKLAGTPEAIGNRKIADTTGQTSAADGTVTYTDTIEGGHKLVRVAGTEKKLCDKPYYQTHFHCTVCGNNYQSPAAGNTVEVSFDTKGHTYGEPAWESVSETVAKAVFICQDCGDRKEVAATIDTENVLYDPSPKCEGVTEEVTAYYPAVVTFNGKPYEGVFSAPAPIVDHKVGSDGKCEYCGLQFISVIFKGRTGDEVSKTYYRIVEQDGKKVVYKGTGDTVVGSAADVTAPTTGPNQIGYTFKNWILDNKDYAYNEIQAGVWTALQAALESGRKEIEITSSYTKDADVNVNITTMNKVGGTDITDSKQTATVKVGGSYTATAAKEVSVGGKTYTFSRWEDANGTALSTALSYTIYISAPGDKVLKAVYTESAEEVKVAPIKIANRYTTEVNGSNKLSFVAEIALPEGCTLVETGFMYTTSKVYQETPTAEMTDKLVIGTSAEKVNQAIGKGTVSNILTINLGTTEAMLTRNVHVSAYVIYQDEKGLQTVYTPVETTSFSAVSSN